MSATLAVLTVVGVAVAVMFAVLSGDRWWDWWQDRWWK